jgi:hypothetical protein
MPLAAPASVCVPDHGSLVLGGLSNETFIRRERHIRRSGTVTLIVRNDLHLSHKRQQDNTECSRHEHLCTATKVAEPHKLRTSSSSSGAAEAAWSTHLVVAHESHARVGGTEINADGRSLGAGGFAHSEWG